MSHQRPEPAGGNRADLALTDFPYTPGLAVSTIRPGGEASRLPVTYHRIGLGGASGPVTAQLTRSYGWFAELLQSFGYSYGPAGTILNETDTPTSSQSPAVYTYDAKSRVTSMTPGTGATLNYTFDASGNLTSTPTGASATYDNAGELTSSTLSGTTTNYTCNPDGQRLAAKQGSATFASGTWMDPARTSTPLGWPLPSR